MFVSQITLTYHCDSHDGEPTHESQPLSDIVFTGTLICPECGEDMELDETVKVDD